MTRDCAQNIMSAFSFKSITAPNQKKNETAKITCSKKISVKFVIYNRRKVGRKVGRFTRSQNKLILVFPYRIIVKSALSTWIPRVFQSGPTSMSAPGAILDRPETERDRPEVISQPKPTGMVLRSQSRAGRSEEVVSAEIHPERPRIATRPEPHRTN